MNIVITGASRGIGFELVKLMVQTEGNTVFAISRNKEKIEQLAQECKLIQPYSTVVPVACDLTLEPEIIELAQLIGHEVSELDILINNAGYLQNKAFLNYKLENIEQIFKVNVFAPMLLVQNLWTLLNKAKQAHVVNISSMGGFQGSAKFAGLAPYSSSKSAIAGLTECLAEEFKESNVKFNALALGAVATEMLSEAFPGYKALITPEQMAAFISDFALNGHKMFNGKVLPVSCTTP